MPGTWMHTTSAFPPRCRCRERRQLCPRRTAAIARLRSGRAHDPRWDHHRTSVDRADLTQGTHWSPLTIGFALVAFATKLAGMPLVGWLLFEWPLGRFVFNKQASTGGGAALPAAQHVFNSAHRHSHGEVIAREAVPITTIGAIPVLVVVSRSGRFGQGAAAMRVAGSVR